LADSNPHENEIAKKIVDAAIEVHRELGGPGLLESVYEEALIYELQEKGLPVERQKQVPICYKGQVLSTPLRLDMLVGNRVIVEVKAVSNGNPVFESQLLTYLRLTDLKLGLLINFGHTLVKNGVRRIINGTLDNREE